MTTKSTLLIIEKSLSSCSSSYRPRDFASILDFFPSSFAFLRYPPTPSPSPPRLFLSRYTISISSNLPPVPISCRWDRNIEREKIFRRASVAASPLSFPFYRDARESASQPATQPGVVRLLESRIRRGLSRSCLLFFLLFKQTAGFLFLPLSAVPRVSFLTRWIRLVLYASNNYFFDQTDSILRSHSCFIVIN